MREEQRLNQISNWLLNSLRVEITHRAHYRFQFLLKCANLFNPLIQLEFQWTHFLSQRWASFSSNEHWLALLYYFTFVIIAFQFPGSCFALIDATAEGKPRFPFQPLEARMISKLNHTVNRRSHIHAPPIYDTFQHLLFFSRIRTPYLLLCIRHHQFRKLKLELCLASAVMFQLNYLLFKLCYFFISVSNHVMEGHQLRKTRLHSASIISMLFSLIKRVIDSGLLALYFVNQYLHLLMIVEDRVHQCVSHTSDNAPIQWETIGQNIENLHSCDCWEGIGSGEMFFLRVRFA